MTTLPYRPSSLLLVALALLLPISCGQAEEPTVGGGPGTSAAEESAGPAETAAPAAAAEPSPAGRRPGRRGSGPPPVITRDQSLSRSRIDFEVTHIDLGQMYQEETRDLEFPFQCNGPDPITLFEPEVSCGCTAPSLEVEGEPWEFGKPIPPGAAGRVLAVFDSKKFQLDKASSIRILGNAVNLPVQLTLKAFILPLFQVSPRMARFDNLLSRELRRNDRPTRYLEVTGAKEFEILRWIDLPEWLEIREVEEPRPAPDGVGQIRKLEVALNPDVPVGRHSTMAMAETSLGKDLAIQVYAEVFGPVRYFPEAFPRFGLVQPGKTEVVRAVSIRATQDRLPIPAPRIEYQGDENVFEITLDEKKPGLRYDLIVGVLPEASPGRHDGKILLTWPEDSELPLEPREFDLSVIISQSN